MISASSISRTPPNLGPISGFPTTVHQCQNNENERKKKNLIKIVEALLRKGAGATFDWLFFDNSKLTDFDC